MAEATEPLAVVTCMIRLGFCLDLTKPGNVNFIGGVFADDKENRELAGEALPKNERHFRRLDRAVVDNAYAFIEKSKPSSQVDTARGLYVPTGGKKRIWDGSWISRDTHIQLCVRNPASILGIWVHHRQISSAWMSVKRSKVELLASRQRVLKAKKIFREMSKLERIDLMVETGSMTHEQAEKAKQQLVEIKS